MPEGMSSSDIRRLFTEFFTERGHELVPSAPLIPKDDPTLLFTSAGMVPFKWYYVDEAPTITRAVSAQRCLRLSDLDEVGRTPYHLTFFEMLGNFSFGDYFKQQAIEWGWEFLTEVIGLPKDPLWVTIHKDDDAAHDIWKNRIGFPADRIVRLGDKDNFWGPAGDSGPCGPCSEIHIDMGPDAGCDDPNCNPGCDCDRYFEIWNLVFPQFLQHPDGTREPLKRPGIDTGMGFERLVSVVQGVDSIYGTDVLAAVVNAARDLVEEATGERPGGTGLSKELAVIADHSRAVAFAIAENILPSNEAQGYVIRRLVRRAVRRGLALGISEPFLYRMTGVVTDLMGAAHPHLVQKREHVALVVKSEEERFQETLAQGSAVFEEVVNSLAGGDSRTIPGNVAFSLYDTYGFPLDLTEEMATERGLDVDRAGFEAAMEEQKERGRRASTFGGESGGGAWEGARVDTRFSGYRLECSCEGASLCESADSVLSEPVATHVGEVRRSDGDNVEFTLEDTPFYAESGGQVSDAGSLTVGGTVLSVISVFQKEDRYVHVAADPDGALAPGASVEARVDVAVRRRTEKNHTATHLLQAALRAVLGDHVHQSGSWVGPDRLRFDFTHFSELSDAETADVEERVGAWIRADLPVMPSEMGYDEAVERGAMALFGEKYGDSVRVVCIAGETSDVSMELCGGTHVERTGEIGAFAIVAESSVAAGVRRIEALTGRGASERARQDAALVREVAGLLKAAPHEMLDKAREMATETSRLRKIIEKERAKSAGGSLDALVDDARDVGGIRVLAARVDAADVKALRALADRLRDRLSSGAGVLGTEVDGSVILMAVVTDDLARKGRLKAGDIVREVSSVMGGRGGGKPHLAQAGGGDPSKLDEALEASYGVVERLLKD